MERGTSLVSQILVTSILIFNNEQHIGLGVAANNNYRANIDGSVRVDGDLVVTGRGVVGSDKYITREYNGDGSHINICYYNIYWWYSTYCKLCWYS